MVQINENMVKWLPIMKWSTADEGRKDRYISDLQKGLHRLNVYSATIDPDNVGADSTAEQDLTVTGVLATDICIAINYPELTAGLMLTSWWIDTADVVSIILENETAGAINEGSGTWYFAVLRRKTTTL